MNDLMLKDLLAAQKEIEGVKKDAKNPFFKSDYATLNATILACKKIMNDHNFIVMQPIQSDVDGVYVCTTLVHTSGNEITSRMRIQSAKPNDPQAQGSAITYARRYSLQSMLLLSAEDDDAEKAMDRKKEYKKAPLEGERHFDSGENVNQTKCELCGTTNQFHKKGCPNGSV